MARWFGDGAGKRDGLLNTIFLFLLWLFSFGVDDCFVRAGRHPRGGWAHVIVDLIVDSPVIFVFLPVMSGFL